MPRGPSGPRPRGLPGDAEGVGLGAHQEGGRREGEDGEEGEGAESARGHGPSDGGDPDSISGILLE